MATSYKGFWLIVGMTAAALVIANATSTKHGSSNHTTSSKFNDVASAPVFPSQPTTSMAPSRPAQEPAVPPASAPALPTVNDAAPTTVTRSIEQDIRSAFDDAVKVALAMPDPKTLEVTEDEPEPPAQLSPLETKDLSSSPKVFDEPAATKVEAEDASREQVRTLTALNLREGPDPAYLKIETLANGTTLFVLEKSGKWWRVKSTTSGAEGWINGTFVKPVD